MISEERSETLALIERLEADAHATLKQAEFLQRDATALLERAARKQQQAFVWERAAMRLRAMLDAGELQDGNDAEEEGEEDVSANS